MPNVFCFGGPNGAGKTTLALKLLPALGVRHFVNADLIAKGLAPLDVSLAQLSAGRLMLQRIEDLKQSRESFGFESTFASHSATRMLKEFAEVGWTTHLNFIYLESAELAIERVAVRVQSGGHFVEEETVRRRYIKGLKQLKAVLAKIDRWAIYDNSGDAYEVVARGQRERVEEIARNDIWKRIAA